MFKSYAKKYDVIVIGAGPSGSASAICCAKAGLDVLIVEREQFPRNHAGETVHPGIEPLLDKLGVLDDVSSADFVRHTGHWLLWNEGNSNHHRPSFVPFGSDHTGPWKGFQLWRPIFDSILLNYARRIGVKIAQPCQVLKPVIDENNRISGIETTAGIFDSSFLIDAAGSQNWLAKKLRQKVRNFSPRLIVWYGYLEKDTINQSELRTENGNHENSNHYDSFPSLIADRDGWTWMAMVKVGLYQCTKLYFKWDPSEKRIKPPPPLLPGYRQIGNVVGQDVTWRLVPNPAGENYFMVGDAAAVLDPSSSHGILRAIMSAMMAGHLIKDIKRNQRTRSNAFETYCRWMYDWFVSDMQAMRTLYAKHPNPPEWIFE
jgi:flavin-dependent dehydrogenase